MLRDKTADPIMIPFEYANEIAVVVGGGSEATRPLVTRAGMPPSAIYDQLAELQVRRTFYIKRLNMIENSLRALVRRSMGFSIGLPEKEREKINKRAARMVKSLMEDGAAPEGEDEDLAMSIGMDVAITQQAIQPFVKARKEVEKAMRKTAKTHPLWAFAGPIKGFGELGLAVILAETSDLAGYANPGKVWKRLGLAPYDGFAASTWRFGILPSRKLTAEEWTAFGYSPCRRAEMYAVVADPLFRQQSVAAKREGHPSRDDQSPCADPLGEVGGDQPLVDNLEPDVAPYRAAYDQRRAHTAITHPEWSKGHSHNDALRYMTKRLIKHLWQAAHGLSGGEAVKTVLPFVVVPPRQSIAA